MGYDGVTTWRVYSAEQSIACGNAFTGESQAREFVNDVTRSRWWLETLPQQPSLTVEVAGGRDGHNVWSFCQRQGGRRSNNWIISIHPEMLNDMVVLHELAHSLAPRWTGEMTPPKRGKVPAARELPVHGSGFAGVLAELAGEFADVSHNEELRDAYRHFGVPVDSRDEWRAAVERSAVIEAIVDDFNDAVDARMAAHGIPRGVRRLPGQRPLPRQVPDIPWGFWLQDARRRARIAGTRLTQRRLAELITPVEPCTERHIRAIEQSEQLPTIPKLRRVAFGAAVVLGMDPIVMRHELGLVRWECGFSETDLDVLRPLNAEWVALVENLNKLLAERPPRWTVEGDR